MRWSRSGLHAHSESKDHAHGKSSPVDREGYPGPRQSGQYAQQEDQDVLAAAEGTRAHGVIYCPFASPKERYGEGPTRGQSDLIALPVQGAHTRHRWSI